jgi:voltage-gated potassium channel
MIFWFYAKYLTKKNNKITEAIKVFTSYVKILMIEKLRNIVIKNNTKNGRRFDLFIQSLILLSLVSFSFETLPNLDEGAKEMFNAFEIISVCIFSVEYLLRVFLSKNSYKYIFSFFGIIDLLAILPFYLASGIDLRSIRIFRLFRLFRVFKLLKYNDALDRVSDAFASVKKELVVFGVATIFLLYVAAVGIYYCENPSQPEQFKSVFHSLWWAVTTLTTVGYGDMYPITVGGKIFTTFVVFIGMGMVAIPTGLLASSFVKTFNDKSRN